MPNDFDFDDDDRPRTKRRREREEDDYDDRPRRSNYRCPYCASRLTPVYVQKVSALGWVVFVVGLFFFLIGCLIGLLFKENVRVCPECNRQLRGKR